MTGRGYNDAAVKTTRLTEVEIRQLGAKFQPTLLPAGHHMHMSPAVIITQSTHMIAVVTSHNRKSMSTISDARVWIIRLLIRVSAAHHRIVVGLEVEFVVQPVNLAVAHLHIEICCAADRFDGFQPMLSVHSHINIQHVNYVRTE